MNTTTYYIGDQIDSARMTFTASGWPVESSTFYPFGQEQSPVTSPDHYKFATLERDGESGLDHATFRQYSPAQGRWMSPDPYLGSYNFGDPQSFNRYSYVGNSPLSFTDPDGLAPEGGSSGQAAGCIGAVALGAPEGCVLSVFFSGFFRGFFDALNGPSFHGSLTPRPSGAIWDEHGGFSATPYSSIAGT